MPVILSREAYDFWLDPGLTNVDVLSDLLKPFDARPNEWPKGDTQREGVLNQRLHISFQPSMARLASRLARCASAPLWH